MCFHVRFTIHLSLILPNRDIFSNTRYLKPESVTKAHYTQEMFASCRILYRGMSAVRFTLTCTGLTTTVTGSCRSAFTSQCVCLPSSYFLSFIHPTGLSRSLLRSHPVVRQSVPNSRHDVIMLTICSSMIYICQHTWCHLSVARGIIMPRMRSLRSQHLIDCKPHVVRRDVEGRNATFCKQN